MSAPLNTYRVWLTSWGNHLIIVEAESEDLAKAQARQLFEETGEEEFKFKGCGIDSIEADLVGPARQQALPLEQGGDDDAR